MSYHCGMARSTRERAARRPKPVISAHPHAAALPTDSLFDSARSFSLLADVTKQVIGSRGGVNDSPVNSRICAETARVLSLNGI